ncbi:hypothetical protein ABZ702_16040 [Streptomyces cyaneofuscatus]|uniref:hypothetical protein n=1 Tax=Streptomyces cyaneofuscatus TaxID=66883 RepID=UPI0033F05061
MRARTGSIAVASAVLAGTLISGSGVAAAAAPSLAPAGVCSGGLKYDIISHKKTHIGSKKTFKSGPGGTLSGSVKKAETISSQVTVTGGATVKGVIAEAKLEVSAALGKDTTTTTGHGYKRKISSNKKYGNMRYGSWGKQVKWRYYYETPNCKKTTRSSGTAKLVSNAHGWKYWETAS